MEKTFKVRLRFMFHYCPYFKTAVETAALANVLVALRVNRASLTNHEQRRLCAIRKDSHLIVIVRS